MDARRYQGEERHRRVRQRHRELQPRVVRRSRQQQPDGENHRTPADSMDEERDHTGVAEISERRSCARADLSESIEPSEICRAEHGADVLGKPDYVGNGGSILSASWRLRRADDGWADEDSRILR